MATTPGGWPYPTDADQLVNGDDAVKALADQAEKRLGPQRVESGLAFLTTSLAGGAAVAMLTFSTPFAAPPNVTAMCGVNAAPIMLVAFDFTTHTAAGINLVFQNAAGVSPPAGSVIRVMYVAVGPA